MKKIIKIFLMILAGLICLTTVYYTIVVLHAGYKTPQIIESIKGSDQMALQLSDLSERQIEILIKVQDPGFYDHNGVDLSTPGAGLTTITQAIVKKLYFEKFKPGIAKIKQTLIAYFVLDPYLSKEDQLELFINLMWFRNNVTGFSNAAQYYYNKPFSELTEDEYISLVAMIVAPRVFCLKQNPDANGERVRRIKLLISGQYQPKGLLDQYYGTLDNEQRENVAPASYREYE